MSGGAPDGLGNRPSIYLEPDLYDEQYQGYRDDIPHYLRLADDTGGPILELGAGTARLSLALAAAGHDVVGVELSERMLGRGAERVAEHALADRIRLISGDMRTLRLAERFPLVIAAFNTLMHLHTLEDQDAALATVMNHLEPEGVFALDLFNPRLGPTGVWRREAEWSGVGGVSSELFLVQEHDEAKQTVESHYHLDRVRPDGLVRRQSAVLKQRYYNRFEIERALRHAGFGRIRFFGGFERRPFEAGATHIVVIARR